MITMHKLTWSFPTSPRNPAKLPRELSILRELTSVWKRKGLVWSPQNGTQREFGEALRNSDDFIEDDLAFERQADTLTEENICWTARARFGTFKFFGLAFVDSKGFCDLTPAGNLLIESSMPHEVLLKQLIKWQYPDPQHNGREYPPTIFHVFPFAVVTRLLKDLDGLSKNELSLFVFQITRMDQIDQARESIVAFREEYSKIRTGVEKKKFIASVRSKLPIPKVTKSLLDYADALIRYFRYTQLFTVKGERLVILPDRLTDVEAILSMKFELYPYKDAQAYYVYYGNPDIPSLPYEDLRGLESAIENLRKEIGVLREKQSRLTTGFTCHDKDSGWSLPRTISEAKEVIFHLRQEKQKLEKAIFEIESRRPEVLQEVLSYFGTIIRREVVDPPTFFEWNTWRVFVSLDNALIQPNFALDTSLQPLDHAPGGKPDMVVHFTDFVVVPEVSLKCGTSQWRDEGTPVPRHVLEVKKAYPTLKVYGLFVAPKIHADTAAQFYICLLHPVIGDCVTVIPITLEQFIEITSVYCENFKLAGDLPKHLKCLMSQLEEAAYTVRNGADWVARFSGIIRKWRENLLNPALHSL